MNETKRPLLLLMILSAAAALLSSAVRVLLTLTQFDAYYGVYNHGTVLPTVYHIALLVITAAIAIAAILRAPKRGAAFSMPLHDASVFLACLCGFLLAANTLYTLYTCVILYVPTTFDILEMVFSIPAMLFFFGLVKKNVKPTVLVFTSFFPVAWSAVCLIRIYFDNTLLHTSPSKTMAELALLCAMLYFLNESRFLLGIASHRLFYTVSLIAPIFLLTHALPSVILGSRLLTADSDSFLRAAIEIVFALFIYARLASCITADDTPAPEAAEVSVDVNVNVSVDVSVDVPSDDAPKAE